MDCEPISIPDTIPIFPLDDVVLFPGLGLPLRIYEPRYRAMITDALARDRRIGMIQPRDTKDPPNLFQVGCVGKIGHVEALEDGRYNIILEGLTRFRIRRELQVETAFRQVEAEMIIEDETHQTLGLMERASLEREARRFADAQGYAVDWNAVSRLDDEAIVNGIAQIAPFDAAAKQALLEADSLSERAELTMQLMQFFGRHDWRCGNRGGHCDWLR